MTTVSPVSLVALFGAGLLSFLSPCVLPLVPVWLAVAAGDVGRPKALVRGTLAFVAGFTIVFVALGTVAGRVGRLVDPSQTWVTRVGGVLLVVFGAALAGLPVERFVPEVRLLRAPPSAAAPSETGTVFGAAALRGLVAGIAFGAAWTPCVGPLLGAALLSAGGTGGAAPGAALLAAYSLGVGLPFLAASLAYRAWPAAQHRLQPVAQGLRLAAGVGLALCGAALALGAAQRLISPAARLLPA